MTRMPETCQDKLTPCSGKTLTNILREGGLLTMLTSGIIMLSGVPAP